MQNTNQTNCGQLDPVGHPAPEDWMSYLYDELPQPSKAALTDHLRSCPLCQASVAGWRRAGQALNTWELPKSRRPFQVVQPLFKWGMAALFVLGFGYGLGRFSVPASDAKALRAGIETALRSSLEKEIHEKVRAELSRDLPNLIAASQPKSEVESRTQLYTDMNALADKTLAASDLQARRLLAVYDEKRREDNDTVLAQLRNFDARLGSLRQDVETVAVLTEGSFRNAQQQLSRLISYTEPGGRFSQSPANQQNP